MRLTLLEGNEAIGWGALAAGGFEGRTLDYKLTQRSNNGIRIICLADRE